MIGFCTEEEWASSYLVQCVLKEYPDVVTECTEKSVEWVNSLTEGQIRGTHGRAWLCAREVERLLKKRFH